MNRRRDSNSEMEGESLVLRGQLRRPAFQKQGIGQSDRNNREYCRIQVVRQISVVVGGRAKKKRVR